MPVVGQTPALFAKAGGAGFVFSPECVAAITNAGMRPDDFGTYESVAAKQAAARKKCKLFDEHQANPVGPAPPAPDAHDRYLASCQSGHLTQNATQQRERGNACTNATDGYSMEGAPCMPHYGSAGEPGTEHYLVTRLEAKSSQENASTASEPCSPDDKKSYPPEKRSADDAERGQKVQAAVAGNGDKYAKEMEAAKGKTPKTPAEEQAVQAESAANFKKMQDARAASAAAVKDSDSFKAAAGEGQVGDLTGKDAESQAKILADCIEAFRQHGMAAMKEKAKSKEAIEQAEKDVAAGKQPDETKPGKTKAGAAKDDAVAAQAREDEAKAKRQKLAEDHEAEKTAAREAAVAKRQKESADLTAKSEADRKAESESKNAQVAAAPPGKKQELRSQLARESEQKDAARKQERDDLNAKHAEDRKAEDKKAAETRERQAGERKEADAKVSAASDEREKAAAKSARYEDAECRLNQGKSLRDGKSPESKQPDGLTGGYGAGPVKDSKPQVESGTSTTPV